MLGSQREPHFQWNIGGIGSPNQNFRVGDVHFMLFMSISFASGTQHKLVFQWNMGFSVSRLKKKENADPVNGTCIFDE